MEDTTSLIPGDEDVNITNPAYNASFVVGRVNAAIVLLFVIIGLPWNAIVIGIILKQKLFTRPSVMLLLHLAIANFLVCLVFMPFHIVLGILVKGFEPTEFAILEKACQVFVLQILLVIASIYIVALMSVDRVIYLKIPMTYEHIVTPWRMFFAVMAVWLLCIVLALLPLFGFGRVGYVPSLVTCSIYSRHPNVLYPAYFMLVVAIGAFGTFVQLLGCGCIIYITRSALLKKFGNTLGATRPSGQTQRPNPLYSRRSDIQGGILKDYTESQLQLVKVFGAIFTVCLLTIIPFVVFGISVAIIGSKMSVITTILHPISYLSMMSRSVLHPILEAYMTSETRAAISKFCWGSVRRCGLCQSRNCNETVSQCNAEVSPTSTVFHCCNISGVKSSSGSSA